MYNLETEMGHVRPLNQDSPGVPVSKLAIQSLVNLIKTSHDGELHVEQGNKLKPKELRKSKASKRSGNDQESEIMSHQNMEINSMLSVQVVLLSIQNDLDVRCFKLKSFFLLLWIFKRKLISSKKKVPKFTDLYVFLA